MGQLEFPHWLMMAGTLLVIAGLIGLVISRSPPAKVQDDPVADLGPEQRPQLPPLPDFLDSLPRKDRVDDANRENAKSPPPFEIWQRAKSK
jgi:hypothetical protein